MKQPTITANFSILLRLNDKINSKTCVVKYTSLKDTLKFEPNLFVIRLKNWLQLFPPQLFCGASKFSLREKKVDKNFFEVFFFLFRLELERPQHPPLKLNDA